MMTRGLRGAAIVACLIGGMLFPAARAGAQATYDVVVGGMLFERSMRAELMRLYPTRRRQPARAAAPPFQRSVAGPVGGVAA